MGKYKKLYKIYHNKKWINLNGNYGISKNGGLYSFISNKSMKTYKDPKGYDIVYLKDSNNKKITCKISRLVGFAYLKNFDENFKYEINHINGDKNNNDYKNLEWCNRQENVQHQFKNLMTKEIINNQITIMNEKRKRKVAKLDKITNEILEVFESVIEASIKTGINKTTIRDSCSGLRKINRTPYNWKYI